MEYSYIKPLGLGHLEDNIFEELNLVIYRKRRHKRYLSLKCSIKRTTDNNVSKT